MPKITHRNPPPQEVSQEKETTKDSYEEFSERVLITHRLASSYGWTYKQIWSETPYPILKSLCKLLDKLEHDQHKFINIIEAAVFKNLKRYVEAMTPKKE